MNGFFGIDYYNTRMYPEGCKLNDKGKYQYAYGKMTVYLNGV